MDFSPTPTTTRPISRGSTVGTGCSVLTAWSGRTHQRRGSSWNRQSALLFVYDGPGYGWAVEWRRVVVHPRAGWGWIRSAPRAPFNLVSSGNVIRVGEASCGGGKNFTSRCRRAATRSDEQRREMGRRDKRDRANGPGVETETVIRTTKLFFINNHKM